MTDKPPPRPSCAGSDGEKLQPTTPALSTLSSQENSLPVAVRPLSLSFTLPRGQTDLVSDVGTQPDYPSDQFTFEDKTLWQDTFATFYEFYQSNTFCDIEIHCGSRVLRCHRVVLACVSRCFRSMFRSNMNNVITIKDVDEVAFNDLVNFAYTAKITLTIQNVETLLSACLVLQVDSVARACCVFMTSHLHASNCIGIRNTVEQHGQMDLVAKAEGFMMDNFFDVQNSKEWNQVTLSCLLNIVSSPNLNVRSEKEVYEAIMKWIKSDLEENKAFLPTLMSKIQLPLLPAPYLTSKVCHEELLKRDGECMEYLNEAMSYQLSLAQVIPEIALSERMKPRKSYAGVIFCVGGKNSFNNPLRTIECYDLRKNQWFRVSEMSSRRHHVGVVAAEGKLYAMGGNDGWDNLKTGEVLKPKSNKWRPIASMSKLRSGIGLAYLNGCIYAVGGSTCKACLNTVERYDLKANSWSMVQPLNIPRGVVAVVAYRSFMYAMGGNNGAASLESCERYDPHLNKWTLIQPMNKRRAGAGVAELNGFLYVVAKAFMLLAQQHERWRHWTLGPATGQRNLRGRRRSRGFDDNSPLDCVEKYHPTNNTWTMVANMSCPRGGVGVAALGGKLYAVGGHDGAKNLCSVEEYDPETDSWIQVADIGTCRAGAGVAIIACHRDDLKEIDKDTQPANLLVPSLAPSHSAASSVDSSRLLQADRTVKSHRRSKETKDCEEKALEFVTRLLESGEYLTVSNLKDYGWQVSNKIYNYLVDEGVRFFIEHPSTFKPVGPQGVIELRDGDYRLAVALCFNTLIFQGDVSTEEMSEKVSRSSKLFESMTVEQFLRQNYDIFRLYDGERGLMTGLRCQ